MASGQPPGSDVRADPSAPPRPEDATTPEVQNSAPEDPSRARSTEPFGPKSPAGRIALVLWAVASIVAVVLLAQRGPTIGGDLQGLLPTKHRASLGEPMVMVRVKPEAEDPAAALRAASLALAQGLPDERVPIAPPVNAVTGWLDRNGLYLMPVSKHEALAERLSPEAVTAGVTALRARLSSPLFGVSGEQARRDPLALRGIMMRESGMLGFVDDPDPQAPKVTGAGDLMSADGKTMLVLLVSDRDVEALEADIDELLAEVPVAASVVGARAERASARARVERAGSRVSIALAAGLVMVLALALRQVRPVLAILAALGSGLAALLVFVGEFSPLTLPLVVLAAGYGCDASLRLQPISSRRWASGLVFTLALAPLLLLPYPEWSAWAFVWAGAMLGLLVVMRTVLPTLVGLLGGDLQWPVRGFHLAPMPLLSLLICIGVTGFGAWCANDLRYESPASLSIVDPNVASRREILRADFFDPDLVVVSPVAAESAEATVDVAAELSTQVVRHVPSPIRRFESPGSYVIPKATLADRRRSLNALGLAPKMQGVHDTLESRGLRAAAFSEFLRGASDIDQIPDAGRALDGPLGPWIERYIQASDDESVLNQRLELQRDATVQQIHEITLDDGSPLPLYGPRVAALEDQAHFGDRVAIAVLASLWLGALLVWLGTGSFAVALSSGITALATQMAVLSVLWGLELPVGPHLLPALMLVGAAAIVASGRACRAIDLQTPVVASGLLVTGLCQVTAGLTLVASGIEPWRAMGIVITVGSAIAAGLGLFAAPGMTMLLRTAARKIARKPKEAA